MADIFLSYSRVDLPRARQFEEALEQSGFSTFWDRELLPGEGFRKAIEHELKQARCVIVLWSHASVQSEWVIDEAESAATERAEKAGDIAALLNKTVLTISEPAGPEGRLFGSVTPKEIVEAIKDARGVRLDRKDVHIEEPIRQVGTYTITVDVHDGVTADVKTIITAAE